MLKFAIDHVDLVELVHPGSVTRFKPRVYLEIPAEAVVSVVRPSDGESVGSPGVAAHAAQARADGAAAQTSGRHRHEALGHLTALQADQ